MVKVDFTENNIFLFNYSRLFPEKHPDKKVRRCQSEFTDREKDKIENERWDTQKFKKEIRR